MKWYEKQLINDENSSEENPEETATIMSKNEQNDRYETNDKKTTIICRDVNLVGNLTSKEDIQMSGMIQGDIVSSKHIYADGNVNGNITCHSLELQNAIINGDITCAFDANICEGTTIKGNITVDNLTLGGHVEGNLMVKGALRLLNSAYIQGSIEASSLESDKGAVLKGHCMITD